MFQGIPETKRENYGNHVISWAAHSLKVSGPQSGWLCGVSGETEAFGTMGFSVVASLTLGRLRDIGTTV